MVSIIIRAGIELVIIKLYLNDAIVDISIHFNNDSLNSNVKANISAT